jgi:hypothetical protein
MSRECSRTQSVPEPLNPEALFRTLAEREIEYVLIGGLAATLHGSALGAVKAEICVDPKSKNALAAHAGFVEGSAFSARHATTTVRTHPAPSLDLSELAVRATSLQLYGYSVRIASLADLIVIAETCGRLEDQAALPHLYALEDELAAIEREDRE